MRSAIGNSPIANLVDDDRVHRSVYRDPEIFELEMKNLFGRAWLYVGHELQIPNPGDFLTLTLARQPVVLVRDKNHAVHVLHNRCGHRGAVVCIENHGNTRAFRCCYHGWTYSTDGKLISVPMEKGFPAGFALDNPNLSMIPLSRVASYRGFVFASFSAQGPSLDAFLGQAKRNIDDLIDLSPEQELAVVAGVHRYEFSGNWKLQIENLNDNYHPIFSHASTLNLDGRQAFRRRAGDNQGPKLQAGKDRPNAGYEKPLHAFPYGHSYIANIPFDGDRSDPVFQDYQRRLLEHHGEHRANEVMNLDWHNTIIYPNLCIQSAAQHIRIINPIAVNRTEVIVYPVLLKGVPDEMNRSVIRYLNITHSAASLIQTDDLEAFARIQDGIESNGSDWLVFARGADQDAEDSAGGWTGTGSGELPVRNQYRAWRDYLTEGQE